MIEFSEAEIKEDRDRLIAELPDKYDQTLEEIRERYHHEIAYSEVMHPAFMLCEIVDGYLAESPCILLDEEAYRQAHLASTALFNLNQRLGTLRYQAETKFKHPIKLNLGPNNGSNNGCWMEVFYMLGRATAVQDEIRSGLAQSIFVYADDPDTDAVGLSIKPPCLESFQWLLEFLGQRTWHQPPALNVDPEGMFSLFYSNADGTERWSVKFGVIDCHEVTRTVNKTDTFGVENTSAPNDSIRLPEWLR